MSPSADGIVDVQTTQREHLTIKVSLGEVDLQYLPSILVSSSMVP